MTIEKRTGWARLVAAFVNSFHGAVQTYREEEAFRQEVWLALVLLPLAFWLEVSAAERALLVLTALLPMVVELLNTAVEAVVDLASPEKHPLAKKAKDAASAAVILSLLVGGGVWLVVLLPKWL